MFKKLLCMSTLALSGAALAHPGHDHSAWSAPLLHLLWVAPALIIAIAATAYFVRRKNTK